MSAVGDLTPQMVLDAINEGVYVTDTTRKILYWGKAAERITGWPASEVVGKRCHDGILCHVDKDGHLLCGKEYCPLHRCMCTGKTSQVPITMFAQTKAGGRVPLQVAVGPLHNAAGEVIGGVETFSDLSGEFTDIQRARKIQLLSLPHELPADPRIRFAARYMPCDIVGGDYYATGQLDADRYGVFLADVSGHGVPAALYTMFLSSLWDRFRHVLPQPAEFARAVNERLRALIQEDEPFAAALCAVFDLRKRELRIVGAGNPGPLLMHADGKWESPDIRGLPLGLMDGAAYEEVVIPLRGGDAVLFFTDGAVEITDARGGRPGLAGLTQILRDLGYPGTDPAFAALEEQMLKSSDRIRFDDDITFIDVRLA
jgi:sigma-B regulation protein RsbU (phosphoserine phosphatase)